MQAGGSRTGVTSEAVAACSSPTLTPTWAPGGILLLADGRERGRDIVLGEGRARSLQGQQLGLSPLPSIYIHPGLDLESLSHGVGREGGMEKGRGEGGRDVESVWEWRRGRETGCSPRKTVLVTRRPDTYLLHTANLTLLGGSYGFSPYSLAGN